MKRMKKNNSKNISRNFSGAVVGSVGSVQFQVAPCFSLHFSISIGPFQCIGVNYKDFNLMHLSLSKAVPFVYLASVCRSFQCLISALTQWAEMVSCLGLLVQSCCEEGGALQTNITGVCGEHSQCSGHTGFAPTHGACAFPVFMA